MIQDAVGGERVVSPRVAAFVMAGGEGRRLRPLTAHCPKPALSVSGDHRLIDFTLSNLYNSKVRSIYVLAQYCPEPLLRHIAKTWQPQEANAAGFVQPLLPAADHGRSPYKGTADSVWQNLHLVDRLQPDVVAVFAADHIYRMDVRQMISFHRERNADATVAAVPVPIGRASQFGIISADRQGCIHGFDEKPEVVMPMSDNPDHAYASMGIYLFRPQVLRQALAEAARRGEHDFGRHVLPRLINRHRLYAYNFHDNKIPGVQSHEEHGYWRDVGTIEAYVSAKHDMAGPAPRFELCNPAWPIHPVRFSPWRMNGSRDMASLAG
jgi:glucose-1-phosphate adenylyltransferase